MVTKGASELVFADVETVYIPASSLDAAEQQAGEHYPSLLAVAERDSALLDVRDRTTAALAQTVPLSYVLQSLHLARSKST